MVEERKGRSAEELAQALSFQLGTTGALALSTRRMTGVMRTVGPAIAFGLQQVNAALKEQTGISQTMVATGRGSQVRTDFLNKNLNLVGLSLSESAQVMRQALGIGLRENTESTLKFLGQAKLLGLNIQALSRNVLQNRDVLGMSSEASIALGEHIVETAAQYGLHSDLLVTAINNLIASMKQAHATYGAGMVVAQEKTLTALLGKFGAGQQKNIEAVMSKIFGGNKDSFVTALRLGIDPAKLSSTSSKEQERIFMQAIKSANEKISSLRGTSAAGITVPALQKAFGFGPEFIALADNLGKLSKAQLKASMDQLTTQQLGASLMQSLNEMTRPFPKGKTHQNNRSDNPYRTCESIKRWRQELP
jgi:hypothetical protein